MQAILIILLVERLLETLKDLRDQPVHLNEMSLNNKNALLIVFYIFQ